MAITTYCPLYSLEREAPPMVGRKISQSLLKRKITTEPDCTVVYRCECNRFLQFSLENRTSGVRVLLFKR